MCKLENGKACVILCLRRYNERKIVMDKKFLRHISSMMLLVCTLAAVSPVTAFAGWQKEGRNDPSPCRTVPAKIRRILFQQNFEKSAAGKAIRCI